MDFITLAESYKYLDQGPPDEDQARTWLQRSTEVRLTDPNGYLLLAVELRESKRVVGYVSLFFSDPGERRQGTFEVMVSPAYRCRGYGTEAALGLIDFGFRGILLHDLRVWIWTQNLPARRMVEKAGMKLEGEFREDHFAKNEWVSIVCFGILNKSNWQ